MKHLQYNTYLEVTQVSKEDLELMDIFAHKNDSECNCGKTVAYMVPAEKQEQMEQEAKVGKFVKQAGMTLLAIIIGLAALIINLEGRWW